MKVLAPAGALLVCIAVTAFAIHEMLLMVVSESSIRYYPAEKEYTAFVWYKDDSSASKKSNSIEQCKKDIVQILNIYGYNKLQTAVCLHSVTVIWEYGNK